MEETKTIGLEDLKKVIGGANDGNTPGFNCVRCGTFITLTMQQIITLKIFECPCCGLKYEIHDDGPVLPKNDFDK